MIANNLQPDPNRWDDLPFQFLGVPNALGATADTTNGAFGVIIQHPCCRPGSHLPTMFITVKTNLFRAFQVRLAFVCDGKWPTAGPGDFVFRFAKIFSTASRLQARRPPRCCCWSRPAGF